MIDRKDRQIERLIVRRKVIESFMFDDPIIAAVKRIKLHTQRDMENSKKRWKCKSKRKQKNNYKLIKILIMFNK